MIWRLGKDEKWMKHPSTANRKPVDRNDMNDNLTWSTSFRRRLQTCPPPSERQPRDVFCEEAKQPTRCWLYFSVHKLKIPRL